MKTGRKILPMSGTKSQKPRTKLITNLKDHLDRYTLTSREQVVLLDNLSRAEWLRIKSLRLGTSKNGNRKHPVRSRLPRTVLLLGSHPRSCAITPSYVVFTLVPLSRRSFRERPRNSSYWRQEASTTALSSARSTSAEK
jgi:hypothetical protein